MSKPRRSCPSCGEQSNDGHLCHTCTQRTKQAIAQIARMWPTLRETIARLDRFGSATEGHARAIYGPLVYRDDISRVADQIRSSLVSWMGLPWPANTVGAICRELVNQSPNLRRHPASVEWSSEMTGCRDRLMKVIDIQDRRALVGPCPERTRDDEPCTGIVWAHYPADDAERPRMQCSKPNREANVCGKVWPPEQWTSTAAHIVARRQQIAGQKKPVKIEPGTRSPDPTWLGQRGFITRADASLIYGIPETTLRRWIKAGKLPDYEVMVGACDRPGRPVLRVVDPGEVATRAAEMMLDKASGDNS